MFPFQSFNPFALFRRTTRRTRASPVPAHLACDTCRGTGQVANGCSIAPGTHQCYRCAGTGRCAMKATERRALEEIFQVENEQEVVLI